MKNLDLNSCPKVFHQATLSFSDKPKVLSAKYDLEFTLENNDGLGKTSYALFEFEGTPVLLEYLHEAPEPLGVLKIPTSLMESKQGLDFLKRLLVAMPLTVNWTSPVLN